MGLESEILVTNYGLTQDFASRLIAFVSGDVETAIRIIEASEKDIGVFKIKFISSRKMANGSAMLAYNFQIQQPEFLFTVVSSDPNLSKIHLENPWNQMYEEMLQYLSGIQSDPDSSSRIEKQILSGENINYINSYVADRSNIDFVNLKRFLLSEISRIMMDTGVVLKVVLEDTDIFHFQNFLNNTKIGIKIENKNKISQMVILTLRIEPILSPLGGKDIEKIQPGDEILVKVSDTREIVPSIIKLLDRGGDNNYAYGKVIYSLRSEETQNTMALLEFGPGIFGRFTIGGSVRLQTREPKEVEKGNNQFQTQNIPDRFMDVNEKKDDRMEQSNDGGKRKKFNITLIIVLAGVLAVLLFILMMVFQ